MAMPFFYLSIKKLFGRSIALICLLSMALCFFLVFYSNELKQYSSDVLFSCIVLYLFSLLVHHSEKPVNYLWMGISGSIIIWFSNPSFLVIVSLGFGWFILANHTWKDKLILGIYWMLPVVISFIIYFVSFIQDHPTRSIMQQYWTDYFLPITSFGDAWDWVSLRGESYFANSLTIRSRFIIIANLMFVIGIVRQLFYKDKYLALLFIPVILHLALSSFKMYPWETRIFLYTLPFILIYIAIGIYSISSAMHSRILLIILTFLIINKSLQFDIRQWKNPRRNEHLRPVVELVESRLDTKDKIYVHSSAIPAFRYYEPIIFNDAANVTVIQGKKLDVPGEFENQLSTLNGRIWFIFSHPYPPLGIKMIDSLIAWRNLPVLDSIYDESARAILVNVPPGGMDVNAREP